MGGRPALRKLLFLKSGRGEAGLAFEQSAEGARAFEAYGKAGIHNAHALLQVFFGFFEAYIGEVLFGRLSVVFFEEAQQMEFRYEAGMRQQIQVEVCIVMVVDVVARADHSIELALVGIGNTSDPFYFAFVESHGMSSYYY